MQTPNSDTDQVRTGSESNLSPLLPPLPQTPDLSISSFPGDQINPMCSSCEIYLRRMTGLENEVQILTNNLYSLFKTAKEEIQRKDKLIKEKDDIIENLRNRKHTNNLCISPRPR
ncbi:hypothetical protein HWI79_4 [Cryptosporidium felis]|nr:hypothetical protein HWI79_4 [Cryptosporidium felis]